MNIKIIIEMKILTKNCHPNCLKISNNKVNIYFLPSHSKNTIFFEK